MEKSAKTIGKRKFCSLPARRQHALLAELARDALSGGDREGFLKRYVELHAWAALDRYEPPPWLSAQEAMEEYLNFHGGLSRTPGVSEPPPAPVSWQPRFPVTVVLDQVRSPYNVGSVLRLIDNYGLKGVVHASPWLRLSHPRLRRAARGCERWIPVRCEPDLPAYLKSADAAVIGIENDAGAVSVERWDPPAGDLVLVLGNETYGIAGAIRGHCSLSVCIPMFGFKKSMNVHHALAVVAQKIAERGVGL